VDLALRSPTVSIGRAIAGVRKMRTDFGVRVSSEPLRLVGASPNTELRSVKRDNGSNANSGKLPGCPAASDLATAIDFVFGRAVYPSG
jgi:hypothetical protein